jgi:hypothetical protein
MVSLETQGNEFYARAERRIGWLTLIIGLAAAAAALAIGRLPVAAGLAAGTVLAWINYRWLEDAVDAMARAATAPAGKEPVRISPFVLAKIFGRYALIGIGLYVMVAGFHVPVLSVVAGLLALGAAAMTEAIYELFAKSE